MFLNIKEAKKVPAFPNAPTAEWQFLNFAAVQIIEETYVYHQK